MSLLFSVEADQSSDIFHFSFSVDRFLKVTILISLFGLVFAVATLNPNVSLRV